MSPFEMYETFRAQLERETGIKAILEPSSIRTDAPLVRISPRKMALTHEVQTDDEDGTLVLRCQLSLVARIEGTGAGFKTLLTSSRALLGFFEAPDEPLCDGSGEPIPGAVFTGRQLSDEGMLVPSEEHERMYEYQDSWAADIAVPRSIV